MKKKVLVVDDASFIRKSLTLMLEKNGYEVVGEAGDGVEAIIKYKQVLPDIVTMDITMPRMTGIQALEGIIKIDPKATIIMVSALGQESFVREAVTIGAKGFIVKPFKEEQVIKALKNL